VTVVRVSKPVWVEGYQFATLTDAQWQAELRDVPGHQARTWSIREASLATWEGRRRSLRPSDFPYLTSHIPLLSGRAREALEPLMVGAAEFRPVVCDGEIYFAVLDVVRVDCLDVGASEITWLEEGVRAMEVRRYVFRADRLEGHHVFGLPQFYRPSMLVDEAFVGRVKEAGLEGLDFDLLWSSAGEGQTAERQEPGPARLSEACPGAPVDLRMGSVDLEQQRAQLVSLATDWLGEQDALRLSALARPALGLVTSAAAGGLTRLGGAPLLPPGARWPSWRDVPLAFLGVVDLSDLAGLEPWIPTSGLVNFFYDLEKQPWGFDPQDSAGWRVIACPARDAVEWGPPEGVIPFPSRPVRLEPLLTIPDSEEDALSGIREQDPERLWEFYEAWRHRRDPDLPRHQIGGWPELIQPPFWEDCELASNGIYAGDRLLSQVNAQSASWRLLLQLDSDDSLEWAWCDGGRLYFSLRDSDAAQGRFDRSWLTLQSC
jgi:uncharacterized protein YwqG